MDQFKIAVAIPTYKREALLRRLISSIPKNWSVFVSDNESSLLPLASSLGEVVTISHSPKLVGMFANWNRALSLVTPNCTHVFIPSDDDLFLPEANGIVANTLARYPDSDILVFGCDLFDEHGHVWAGYRPLALECFDIGEGFHKFAAGVDARMPGVLFRKDFLQRIGAFDERFELTAADSELIQRALLLGKSVFVPSVIGLYQIWSGSLTHARQATDQWLNEVEAWTEKIGDLINSGNQPHKRQIDVQSYRDEIFIANLLAGIGNLIQKGQCREARDFLARHTSTRHLSLRTRLRLIRARWRLARATE
ncbi:glycosyltransferase [Paucibacter sp. KCTC 42545]|uniref:glycosyltransferase n=1 Tax=Paucibacter sp. KCTC 42545 TaxID=1768242 RepID=UPI0012E3EE01|nr:glycosyltransferase [Paucibacter sp. KCTC 42545]